MSNWDYWLKQTDEPLFPDVEWQKPQTKARRGKLLIVGGHAQGFELPAKAMEYAKEAEAGEVQILLPDVLQKLLPDTSLPIVFGKSTPAGSFAKDDERLKDFVSWADHVLLAGDFGRNAETSLFIDELISMQLPLTLTKDSLYYANHYAGKVLDRADTVVVASFSQLQTLLKSAAVTMALDSTMSLVDLVEYLHEYTEARKTIILTFWQDNMVVASEGFVSTTKAETDEKLWQLKAASYASVYAMQHPSQQFEAITTSVF